MDARETYKLYERLLNASGKTSYAVAKYTGISNSFFTDWKAGRYVPKVDKLQKLADYFGVPLSYFTGEAPAEAPAEEYYYVDPQTRQLAEMLHKHPEYGVVFDALPDLAPQDAKIIIDMVNALARKDTE